MKAPPSQDVIVGLREARGEAQEHLAPTGAGLIDVVEADGATRFRVRVIEAGLSGNRNFYPDAALREGARLFAGARVIVKDDATHLAGRGKDPRAVIGRIVDPVFVPGAGADTGAIEATMDVIDPADPMVVRLREAVRRGMGDMFGLSIDARAAVTRSAGTTRVTRFTAVNSVDLIVEPGAGGRVLDVIEAAADPSAHNEDTHVLRDILIRRIRAARPQLLEGRDVAALSDTDLEVILTEALAAPAAIVPANSHTPSAVNRNDLEEAVRAVEARQVARQAARDQVVASTLPEAARARVLDLLEARGDFGAEAVTAAIATEQSYLAPYLGSGRVAGLGPELSRISVGETRGEKVRAMFEAFFDPAHKDHRHARSLRQCYVEVTGDHNITGQVSHCDQALMREALDSTSLADVLGDSITRRMLADYATQTVYDVWRQLTGAPVPVRDFRRQERTRWGGYGDLPVVAENGAYQPVTSPGDEKAEYAIAKRGGTESITIEMIANDDVGVVQRIPQKLSRAAKRTLAKFVLDFIVANPAIYDGKAWFHADHGNLGSAAFSAAAFAAARLAMLKQTEPGSNDRLGIAPANLWLPADLQEAAYNAFQRSTNLDKTFVQSLVPNIIPVWYWTDANDWAATADPADAPIVELGFLAGQEEPELFVQDSPTAGSLFSNDRITWKIRHIYGGAIVDYRPAYKSVVAA